LTKYSVNKFSADFEALRINPEDLLAIDPHNHMVKGLMLTFAPTTPQEQGYGEGVDYVSRYFAPWVGINEDPATGSSQSALAPFWAKRLQKNGPMKGESKL